jgi:phosphoribosylglycinamide formyltransferase-1
MELLKKRLVSSFNWAIFMSGWGRSAVKTLELQKEGRLKDSRISVVVYETEENGILNLCRVLNIPAVKLVKKEFSEHELYYEELRKVLQKYEVDYIFLLGYKHIIREPFLSWYNNRIVNIHPALLPAFRGKRAIQQAMEYGVKITGLTTHLIDAELDEGTILCQRCIPIKEGETFEELDLRFVEEGKGIIEETFQTIENYE